MNAKRSPILALSALSGLATAIFFLCSSVRHALFKSNAYDLGWFDQIVYLISRGQPPFVPFAGYHLLGDHVSVILYPIALLYRLYADVHWLFALQSLALAAGIPLIWLLARQAGLDQRQSWTMALVYLLYPLVFNVNLYDFHPEVFALPGLLAAVWSARAQRLGVFIVTILLVLSCKSVLSLTVTATGLWLAIFVPKQRHYGAIALGLGVAWFLLATQVIVPQFNPDGVPTIARYSYLGDSVLAAAANLILKPHLVLGKVFSLATLEYLALLCLPLIWGLHPRHLTPLVATIPAFGLNVLSTQASQRNIVLQYAVPIFPFLLLAIISAWAAGRVRWRPRWIVLWSLVGFLALAKYGYFWTEYLSTLDTWGASREAIALIETKGPVLAPAKLVPHLTHREIVQLPRPELDLDTLVDYDYILLDLRHPGFASSPAAVQAIAARLATEPSFFVRHLRNDVVLYEQFAERPARIPAESPFAPKLTASEDAAATASADLTRQPVLEGVAD